METRKSDDDRHPVILSVEGNIGAGKTTYLEMLKDAAKKRGGVYRENNGSHSPPLSQTSPNDRVVTPITFVPEPVETWKNVAGHNMLQLFYDNPKEHSLLFQATAAITRARVLDECLRNVRGHSILERSITSDGIFAANCHASGLMSDLEYAVYMETWGYLMESNRYKVDGIIYLRESPETAFARKQVRGRTEEKSIVPQYLVDLHNLHEETFGSASGHMAGTDIPVLVIDAEQDFRPGSKFADVYAQKTWDFIEACM